MNDSYSTFPKVVSVGQNAMVTVNGLRDRTIIPGETYNVQILCMVNHNDQTQLKISARPPIDNSPVLETSRSGIIEFFHTFATQGEYSVVIRRDDDAKTQITTERIYAASPELAKLRPYKGDMHIHTYYSDGRISPIQMAVVGRKLGLDFAAITDHGRYEPSLEAIEMAKRINLDLLLFPGEEVSLSSFHIVSVGASDWVSKLMQDHESYVNELAEIVGTKMRDKVMVPNLDKEQYAPVKWAVDKIHEFGGYAFLAHTHWVAGNRYHLHFPIFDQLYEDGDIDGLEVIGGFYPWQLEANLLSITQYYREVARGRKIPIVGNSDTHYRTPPEDFYGWYWTVVFAESLSREGIFDGILNLKSVACQRPSGQRLTICGPYDLVEYACFLDREFFPLHDRICGMEADIYMDILMGKATSAEQLDKLKENLQALYAASWQTE